MATISVVIIACPCALGLATPTAIMVGVRKGAKTVVTALKATTYRVDQLQFRSTIRYN